MRKRVVRRREAHCRAEESGVRQPGGEMVPREEDFDDAVNESGRRKVGIPAGPEYVEEGVGGGRGVRE